jgi:hypothetical protein
MTEAEVLLSIAQGLVAIVIGAGGWMLRRALDEAREGAHALATLRERVIRVEAHLSGLDRLETKLDALADDMRDVRERVASWAGPRVS